MILVNEANCIGCGACTKDCKQGILAVKDGKLVQPGEDCLNCGHCVALCPTAAISIPGYDMEDIEVVARAGNALDPDRLLTAIKSRRSIRHFQDRPVSMEQIEKIVEAARYTPTGANRQEVEYILVRDRIPELTQLTLSVLTHLPEHPPADVDPSRIERYRDYWPEMERLYREEGNDQLFYRAPAVLVFTGRSVIDAALAASSAELMVHALGLGCVYVGFLEIAAKTSQIQEFFGLEQDRKLVCCLAIGHPDIQFLRTAPRQKKEIRLM